MAGAGRESESSMLSSDIEHRYRKWLEYVDDKSRDELKKANQTVIEDAFYRDLTFGTGGLRGKLGTGPNRMNTYTVGRATQGLADWLNATVKAPTVALCRDTRHGSEEFVRRAASVLAANGIRSYVYERVEPTPALSFAVRELGCSAGVNITASHNPASYNGYKVYGPDGCQITVDVARAIQAAIDSVDPFEDVRAMPYAEATERAFALSIDESVVDRFVALDAALSADVDCIGLRVAYTPLHGVGLECVSKALAAIGVSDLYVVEEQTVQDGDFPTCPKPNPEEPEALALGIKLCEDSRADLLLATDPDCDRLGVAVPHGGEPVLLSGNEVGLLLLDFLAEAAAEGGEDLSSKVACTTVVSAPMADDIARVRGFELRRTLTGFKFIGEQIGLLESEGRETDFLFGFEESYGYLAGTHARDKDAVATSVLACKLASRWKREGLDLYEAMQRLYERYGFWASALLSRVYEGPEGAERMSAVMRRLRGNPPERVAGLPIEWAVDYACGTPMPVVNPSETEPQTLPPSDVLELRLSGGSRVIVRPSGTEPKMKAYLFAKARTREESESLLAGMSAEIEMILGGVE